MKNLVCPISTETIDSNVSRLTVFFNVILMAIFLVTLNPAFIIVVTLDYFIRAAIHVKYSPIRLIALWGIGLLRLKKKPIGLAQKVFASRLGFLVALTSTVLILSGYPFASMAMAGLLMALSIMDSVFNFCVGCRIYSYVVIPYYKMKQM